MSPPTLDLAFSNFSQHLPAVFVTEKLSLSIVRFGFGRFRLLPWPGPSLRCHLIDLERRAWFDGGLRLRRTRAAGMCWGRFRWRSERWLGSEAVIVTRGMFLLLVTLGLHSPPHIRSQVRLSRSRLRFSIRSTPPLWLSDHKSPSVACLYTDSTTSNFF